MPWVRLRGSQALIVHGERNPESAKVEQQTLFALYSQAEAREATGAGAHRFGSLAEAQRPDLRFDWMRIRRAIPRLTPHLPERYDDDEARQRGRFRAALRGCARQLFLTDPQNLVRPARLVSESRVELQYLAHLVKLRLEGECGDRETALAPRVSVWRSTGRCAEAAGASQILVRLCPEMS